MTDKNEKVSIENLDLAFGYHAEWETSTVCLVDPEGRQVAHLPKPLVSEDQCEAAPQGRTENPSESWRGLCQMLLARVHQQALENEALGRRVEELEEQSEAMKVERDQANAVAESLYQNFRDHVRRVRCRKQ